MTGIRYWIRYRKTVSISVPDLVAIVRHIQAFAAWQWWQYCCGELPAGKAPLRINLDETSVRLFQGGGKGWVFATKKYKEKKPTQNVSKGQQLSCMTHVGLICDRPDLQPLLPQVIIGNESTFPAKGFHALKAASLPNVFLIRQKSAWNNIDIMIAVIKLLAAALKPYMKELQPILLLDACRVHFADRVIAACIAANIWPVIIPAKMTWLLQPLDTHAFFKYKVELKKAYQSARAATEDGILNISLFLTCVYCAIKRVLQGCRWSRAFDENGFGKNQEEECRLSIKKQLEVGCPITVPVLCPTYEQFMLCFPKKARFSIAVFLRPFFVGPAAPPRALPRPPIDMVAAAIAAGDVYRARTRGEKRKADGEAIALPRGHPIACLKRF